MMRKRWRAWHCSIVNLFVQRFHSWFYFSVVSDYSTDSDMRCTEDPAQRNWWAGTKEHLRLLLAYFYANLRRWSSDGTIRRVWLGMNRKLRVFMDRFREGVSPRFLRLPWAETLSHSCPSSFVTTDHEKPPITVSFFQLNISFISKEEENSSLFFYRITSHPQRPWFGTR